jgi:hypothetical protein
VLRRKCDHTDIPTENIPLNGTGATDRLKGISERTVRLTMSAMVVVALIAALWATRTTNPLRGDSAEYLYFDPSRSVGYPAFLELVRLSTGHVAYAVQVQMVLLAGSLLFLGWSFHEFVRRPAWSLIFLTVLLIQAGMWFASAFLMTEALSTALIAIWCAQRLRMLKAPSLRGATLLVAISALATTVRPSLIALFFGSAVFVTVVLPKREQVRALALAAAGLVAAWAATPIGQYLVHGSADTTSPFARGVLQHTLYCDQLGLRSDPDSLFVEQRAAPVRRYIDSAPYETQEQLRRSYSTPLRFGSIIPVLGRRHHLQVRSEVDPYLSRIAGERVRANPFCYARNVAREYLLMAIFATDPTAEEGRRTNAFMANHPPAEVAQYPILPGDERLARRAASEVGAQVAGLNPPRQRLDVVAQVPFLALLPFRLLFGAAAMIGLCSLLALPFRQRLTPKLRPMISVTAALGVAFHGALLITAIVEIGFFRYLVPLWPVVCTLLALAMLSLFEAKSRLVAPRAPTIAESAELTPALTQ